VVHSLKDLPLKRPDGIVQGAFPLRDNPRDVLVLHRRADRKLVRGEPIRIGSCSIRRRAMAEFLEVALPGRGRQPRLEFADLRGSVEHRVAQLYPDQGSLDGAILALAGLNRLWMDPQGRRILKPLLASLRLIVLPLTACPAAPGQGVLAVECRKTDAANRQLLARLDDGAVRRAVVREFSHWRAQGFAESCGVTAQCHPALGELLFTPTGLEVATPPKPRNPQPFDGNRLARERRALSVRLPDSTGGALFLAHWAALPIGLSVSPETRVWVSGVESWKRLAARGVWVEGCAENLGFTFLKETLGAPALRLPPLDEWTVLTHRDAVPSWRDSGIGKTAASYELLQPRDGAAIAGAVAAASHFFWGSPQQFERARPWLPDYAHHACGPGKTAAYLQARGVAAPSLFPSRRAWQQWLA
jgi:hypothetical protein